MASKVLFSLLTFTLLSFSQLHFSSGQVVKGAYWFRASEFPISSIDSTLFTHLFCAFADLDPQTNQVVIAPPNQDSFSQFTTTVQQKNPSVKTLLSIGGGNATKEHYAAMAGDWNSRQTFIESSIRLARQYGFHGLDIDWEYPQTSSQMDTFGYLVDEWRLAVTAEARSSGRPELILSAAVFYSPNMYGVNYVVPALARSLDFINVMSYDFYAPNWSPSFTNAIDQLYDPAGGKVSVSYGIEAWIQAGFPSKKVVLGMPFFGYAWQLQDPNNHGLLAPASGAPVGQGDGSMGYNQIRDFIVQNRATTVFDASIVADYCYAGTTWIGYDDTQTVTRKVSYAKGKNLLGYFAWHVGVDYDWILSRAAAQSWSSSSLVEEM